MLIASWHLHLIIVSLIRQEWLGDMCHMRRLHLRVDLGAQLGTGSMHSFLASSHRPLPRRLLPLSSLSSSVTHKHAQVKGSVIHLASEGGVEGFFMTPSLSAAFPRRCMHCPYHSVVCMSRVSHRLRARVILAIRSGRCVMN